MEERNLQAGRLAIKQDRAQYKNGEPKSQPLQIYPHMALQHRVTPQNSPKTIPFSNVQHM